MILSFSIFVKEEYLGQMEREVPSSDDPRYHPVALCCPCCGDIWARLVVEGEGGKAENLRTYFGPEPCEQHAPIWLDGGTLVNCMYLPEFRPLWPASVWNRELRMWAEQVGDWNEVELTGRISRGYPTY